MVQDVKRPRDFASVICHKSWTWPSRKGVRCCIKCFKVVCGFDANNIAGAAATNLQRSQYGRHMRKQCLGRSNGGKNGRFVKLLSCCTDARMRNVPDSYRFIPLILMSKSQPCQDSDVRAKRGPCTKRCVEVAWKRLVTAWWLHVILRNAVVGQHLGRMLLRLRLAMATV